MKKRKVGRPKLAKGDALATVITIRLHKAERVVVGDAAKADGRKLSEWARAALLRAALASRIPNRGPEVAGIEPHGVSAPQPGDVKPR